VVRTVGPEEDPLWDALVDVSPTANRFLRSDCLRMLEETDSEGIRFQRLGAFDAAGKLLGGWALPVMQRMGIRASTYFEFFYAGPMLVPELESGSVHVCRERLQVLERLAGGHARRLHVVEAEGHPRLRDARGVHYAGWQLHTLYTHVWDLQSPEDQLGRMNRERRRLIRRAGERYSFAPLPREEVSREFIPLYRRLMQKFYWVPVRRWDRDLVRRMDWLTAHDAGAVFGARDKEGQLCAAVIVLLSPEDRTLYLWRCGYRDDQEGNSVVPGLYWHACLHWRERWGAPLLANLGGSPRASLSQFKDYLGAEAVPHLRLVYHPPGWRSPAWRVARTLKERFRVGITRAGLSFAGLDG